MFRGHGGHRNFLKHFDVVATGLDGGRLYKVFLDGASANEFYQEIIITRQVELLHMLIDIGTCNLFIVHGALKTEVEKSHWKIKEVLKKAFQILHDR